MGEVFWAHGIANLSDDALDGIHLLWTPPISAGYSLDGFDIWRREHRVDDKLRCLVLSDSELETLHARFAISLQDFDLRVQLTECPTVVQSIPDEPFSKNQPLPSPQAIPNSPSPLTPSEISTALERRPIESVATVDQSRVLQDARRTAPVGCIKYTLKLREPCFEVLVVIQSTGGLALALREDKVVSTKVFESTGDNESWRVVFENEGIDCVLFWVGRSVQSMEICCRTRRAKTAQSGWSDATLIAKNIQLPFQTIHSSAGSVEDEEGISESRLVDGEKLGAGQFELLSESMNGVLKADASPVHWSAYVRDNEDQPFTEVSPWSMGLALALEAHWRRALGLGFLDKGNGLVDGRRYDYRIVGRFYRRDVQESLLGFHSVPIGTALPKSIYLDNLLIEFSDSREVISHPAPPTGGVFHVFRKGVSLKDKTTLTFPEPLEAVVLECELDSVNATYRALSESLLIGTPAVIDEGNLPKLQRVRLDFAVPVVRLEIRGEALLYGVRLDPVPAAEDPLGIVEQDAFVEGVTYEKTAAPNAPAVLGTVNLQKTLLAGSPEITTQTPPNLVGFTLWWLPPPAGDWPLGWWPDDVPSAAPSEVIGFALDRRQVDGDRIWRPFEVDPQTKLPYLVASARSARHVPEVLHAGDDLLQLYPELRKPDMPVPLLSSLEDVLISLETGIGPAPGSLHQYRIRSVDAIGRQSSVATEGSVVQLQKRRPPPDPPAR